MDNNMKTTNTTDWDKLSTDELNNVVQDIDNILNCRRHDELKTAVDKRNMVGKWFYDNSQQVYFKISSVTFGNGLAHIYYTARIDIYRDKSTGIYVSRILDTVNNYKTLFSVSDVEQLELHDNAEIMNIVEHTISTIRQQVSSL